MPDWIFKNKPTAYATLASPSGTSGTTLTLTTGHGTRLPAPGAGQISAVRIENELITYTGNSGDVLTGVTRGAGATNHVAGTEVKNVLVEEWANAVTALSTDTKAALAGTSGTPQAANPYVTNADARNSNARTPTAHSHVEGDTTGLVADLAARVLSTDSRLSDARTPTSHAPSHKAAGGDVLAGIVGGYAPLDSGLLVPVANLATGTPTGLKFLRDDRVWAVPAGGGGSSLTIEEVDGTPSVASATKLILPNGTVSVSGTEATYTPAGGGGGATIFTSTYGSPPASPTNGDLWLPSDSFYDFVRVAGAWEAHRGGRTVTLPLGVGSWTWANQGDATLTNEGGSLYLHAPGVTAYSARCVYKAAPTPPYTLTVELEMSAHPTNNPFAGLFFRDSTSGKLIALSLYGSTSAGGNPLLYVFRFNTPTSAADVPISGVLPNLPFPRFFQLEDDNTNLRIRWGHDGVRWSGDPLYTVSRTSFSAAPDGLGFFAQPANSSTTCGIRIFSWKEA
jgi:hypothetical protein